ncbi:MAG TPA: CPBP family intramembrane glutamic endopeptidase, partial [Candidatus Acidoferrales bacterium]|nr:CPBP family intramembrane glutamic endopeptidase [Candidatus Acidoferrales bacterium]
MTTDGNNWLPPPKEELPEGGSETSPKGAGTTLTSGTAPDTGESNGGRGAAASAAVPDDLRTPWSWGLLGIFFAFAFVSLLVLETGFILFGMVALHASPAALQQLATTNAAYVTLRQTLWFLALMLYLFGVVRHLHGAPFWRTIGWRRLRPRNLSPRRAMFLYLLGGAALAIGVSVTAKLIGTKSKLPIEALFRDRRSVLLVMALALLAAPLVEETIFRGYVYPVVARSLGVPAGVVITGALFGMLHATQLWGAWGLLVLLGVVGVVLTYAR